VTFNHGVVGSSPTALTKITKLTLVALTAAGPVFGQLQLRGNSSSKDFAAAIYTPPMRRTIWTALLVALWLVPGPVGLTLFALAAYCHGTIRTPKELRYRNPLMKPHEYARLRRSVMRSAADRTQ
jgi:hypothetical protein